MIHIRFSFISKNSVTLIKAERVKQNLEGEAFGPFIISTLTPQTTLVRYGQIKSTLGHQWKHSAVLKDLP